MTLEQFADLAEIVGVIVIIASLAYLIRQVKQGNLLATAQTRQRMMEHGQSELYRMMDDANIWRRFTKETSLTAEEQVKFSMFLTCAMRQREWEWFQYDDGAISRDVYEAYHGVIAIHLGVPRSRQWWKTIGRVGFDPRFVAAVDSLLANEPLTSWWDEISRYDSDDSALASGVTGDSV